MSWVRIDDGFASHPKIAQLTNSEFRVWMRTLCFCARYQDPSIDQVAISEVSGLTAAVVTKFKLLGLLDSVGRWFEIHDWEKYQPKDLTGAERQARWRARNASRNGQSDGVEDESSVTDSLPSRARGPVPSRPVPVQEGLDALDLDLESVQNGDSEERAAVRAALERAGL